MDMVRVRNHLIGILVILIFLATAGMDASAAGKASQEDIAKAYDMLQKYGVLDIGDDLDSIRSLKPVAENAVKGCSTDYDRIKGIYSLVKNNMTYDKSYQGKNSTSVGIWNVKRGVCEDYALLCMDFLHLLGIPCQFVTGYNHAYNAAWDSASKRWIIFDATWGRFDLKAADLAAIDCHELSSFEIKYGKHEYVVSFDSYTSKYRMQLYKVDPDAVTLEIPKYVEGFPVTLTYIDAFKGYTKIESVIIPDSFTGIGYFNSNRIREIFIPKSVTRILMLGCYGLKTIYYEGTKAEWERIEGHAQYDKIVCFSHGKHSLRHFEYLPATHYSEGHMEYYYCSTCGKYFKTKDAAYSDNISKEDTMIYSAKTVKLSNCSYTYTGKTIKPDVTVKDSRGNTISSSYYTITYGKNTSVGKGTAKVAFKGRYSGSITLTFKINPKATALTAVTAGKKAFTAKWKKNSAASGYEIAYSTSSKFTAKTTKTIKVKGAKACSKKVRGLAGGKKYYVKIRTYRMVDKTCYYSSWSRYMTVVSRK